MKEDTYRAPVLLFLVSGTLLLFEVLSTRATKIVFSNDFDFIVLSLAFLGFGIGGMLAYFWSAAFAARKDAAVIGLLAAYVCAYIASTLALDPLHSKMAFFLASLFFYTIGGAITALLMAESSSRIHRIYGATLAGSAAGAAGSVILLNAFGLEIAIKYGITGILLALVFWVIGKSAKEIAVASLIVVCAVFAGIVPPITIRCEYVLDEVAHRTPIKELHNSYSYLQFFEIDPKYITKDSRRSGDENLSARGYAAVIDCIGSTDMLIANQEKDFDFLFDDVRSFPYALQSFAEIFVMGSGLGVDVQRAQAAHAKEVTAVEINPALVEESMRLAPNFSPYGKVGVYSVVSEGRRFLSSDTTRYDLIYISNSKRYGGQGIQPYALLENYLFTEEAFALYLSRLHDPGWLYTTDLTWFVHRYKDTLVRTLVARGERPQEHLVFLESGKYGGLLYRNESFSDAEREALLEIASQKGFSATRVTDEDVSRSLHDKQSLVVTDDHPFFWNRYVSPLSDIEAYPDATSSKNTKFLSLRTLGAMLAAACAVLLGALLLTYRVHRRAIRLTLFFACIGIGFMMVELALLQKMAPLYASPSVAMVCVLIGILFWAGAGSLLSGRVEERVSQAARLLGVVIALIALGFVFGLSSFVAWLFFQSDAVIVAATLLTVGIPAFFMGMMFPLGVRLIRTDGLLPWVFGINGIASVVGSIGAMIIALMFGFSFVFLAASLAYALSSLVLWE